MRKAAFAFNARLRAGFGEEELAEFERVLGRLLGNVAGSSSLNSRGPVLTTATGLPSPGSAAQGPAGWRSSA